MNKKHAGIGSLALLLLLGVAWGMGWFAGKDPQLADLERMRDEQFAKRNDLSDVEQREGRRAFGEKMQGLSEEQRRAFFESSAPIFMKMFEARIDRFLAMSPEEQKKEMDKRIDEIEARADSPGTGGRPGGGGPPGGGSPQKIDEFRKKMLNWTTPEQRAKLQMAMQMFQERMKERGVNPPPGRGPFF